ncbi:MAG: polysaccharide deacetylase family protein [Thiohalomonadaceae bacterium]
MRKRHNGAMRRLFTALLLLLLPAFAAAVESHAVVFMYHRFGEERYPSTSVRIDQFEAHLDWLAGHGYTVWPLERIVRHLETGEPMPDRTVAITVDDAYRSVYRHAFPRMVDRGWPFTVFVNTDSVDRKLPDYMTWEQMREMQARGVRFANHGAGHAALWRRQVGESEGQWRERVRGDIERAQSRLQAELGTQTNTAPALFAYPYGEYTLALADRVQALGYVGFGQHSGAIGATSDRRALPRYPMAENYAAVQEFALKAASLPLPIAAVEPAEPLVRKNPPRLTLTLADSAPPLNTVRCYAGGAALPITVLSERRFSVSAEHPLPRGRSRYNCTAPDAGGTRYHWFSQPWLIP